MKVKPLFIDKTKVRKTLSIIGNREDSVYQAHSLESPNLIPYVAKNAFDLAIQGLKNPEQAAEILKQLGL